MKVVITEKPSVARDIAAVLKITEKKKGSIEGRGCAITWAFGHLVTLLEPGEYNPELRKWRLDSLPFIPDEFKLKLIDNQGVSEQFETIKRLCQEADEIVCATDAGREGELIFRYILALSECEDKPLKRLWLSSLTPDAIKEAFKDLKDGHDYDPLYAAAKCRSESDWIVGLNATRCFTVRHGRLAAGDDRVLWSIGRVQTPVLAMIVQRDDEIFKFRAKAFWELATKYRDTVFKYTGDRFDQPEKAQELLDKITGQPFTVTGVAGKQKKEQPPQLFDLTTLQREINKSNGLSAADTLAATQNLYESKLVTYPRTDSRYLSADMKPRIPGIFQKLKPMRTEQIKPLDLAKLPFTKRIVDDKKVTDHHAIIPTGIIPGSLGGNEQMVYNAIVTQFIAAFYPICLKKITTVDGESVEVKFQAKGTVIVEPGWSVLFPKKKKKKKDPDSGEEEEEQTLPEFKKGESGDHEPSTREGKTKPPQFFTENSLLGAMEAAGKWVDDDALREALKERGIGTPATRAAIIETLLRRNYIYRQKKQIRASDMGRCLIALIRDPLLKSPEMTGEWEEKLKQIERSEAQASDFMDGIHAYTRGLIKSSTSTKLDTDRFGDCPVCGKEVIKGKTAYGCSGWKEGCKFVLESEYKGLKLTANQVQVLLQLRVLPYPVHVEDQLRLLLLNTQGDLMDVDLPSADRQKSAKDEGRPAKKPKAKAPPNKAE
ncbi:DNA topoisomerase 3 [Pontiella sulfatireligans]|uniref:DNA topoisomerase n=1 Tax=Pontiella sulfatireligans TaxID=2750658 RepID=A0A6C2ULS8_9BACT|nr:DNA topoisomerase 3 [Pontiella sulfatireligans]VGO20919.1 DNA topoisomerase 3 [Pontiella sulfatireligans]